MSSKPVAFVLMPFEDEFELLYVELLEPILAAAGYEARKADSTRHQRNLMKDVITGIDGAYLVIADVTTMNPNVMYELGICHALSKPTVMIAQAFEDLPFDVTQYRAREYPTEIAHLGQFRKWLTEIATGHLAGEITFENPVSDFHVSPRRGDSPNGQTRPAKAQEHDDDEDDEAKGWLDYRVDMEEASGEMGSILESIAEGSSVLTARIERNGESIGQVAESDQPGAATRLQKLIIGAAGDIGAHAKEVAAAIPKLEATVVLLGESVDHVIQSVDISTADDAQQARELRTTMTELVEATQQAYDGTLEYQTSVRDLIGVNRELSRACRKFVSVQDQLLDVTVRVRLLAEKAVEAIDAKLDGYES